MRPPIFLTLAATAAFLLHAGCATTVDSGERSSVSANLIELSPGRDNAQAMDVRARQLFIRGLTQAQFNDHDAAIKLFNEALKLSQDQPAILSALAASYQAQDDLPSALFYADQARTGDPENVHYYEQIAELQLQSGSAERAIEAYENLLARFPGHIEALLDVARLYVMTGRSQDAISRYENLLDYTGEYLDVYNQMLQIYIDDDDQEGMERVLETMIALEPENSELQNSLSKLYIRQGRTDEAVTLLQEAIKSNPFDFGSVVALSEVYQTLGEESRADSLIAASFASEHATASQLITQAAALYGRQETRPELDELASRLLRRALELEPSNANALIMLGNLRFDKGDYPEAADLLYQSLQQTARDPQRWFRASAAYLQSDQPQRAAEVADEGLLLFPGRIELLRVAAYGLLGAYRNEEAIARFDEALAILEEEHAGSAAEKADLFSSLALLYERKRDYTSSDSLFSLSIDADPKHALSLNNWAYSLAERNKRLDEALGYAQRAVALEPQNPSFLDTLGWIYFKLENYQQAKEWIQKSIATGSSSAAVYEHYGDVLARMGEFDEARKYWEQALLLNPDNRDLQLKLETQQP